MIEHHLWKRWAILVLLLCLPMHFESEPAAALLEASDAGLSVLVEEVGGRYELTTEVPEQPTSSGKIMSRVFSSPIRVNYRELLGAGGTGEDTVPRTGCEDFDFDWRRIAASQGGGADEFAPLKPSTDSMRGFGGTTGFSRVPRVGAGSHGHTSFLLDDGSLPGSPRRTVFSASELATRRVLPSLFSTARYQAPSVGGGGSSGGGSASTGGSGQLDGEGGGAGMGGEGEGMGDGTTVPEPSSIAALASLLAVVAFFRIRRKRPVVALNARTVQPHEAVQSI